MSIVAKKVNIINDSFQSLNNLSNDLEQKLSEVDKQLDQMYHAIEHGKYGTVQSHKILTQMQKLRRQRRVIKHEIQRIAPMVKIIKDKDLLNRLK